MKSDKTLSPWWTICTLIFLMGLGGLLGACGWLLTHLVRAVLIYVGWIEAK